MRRRRVFQIFQPRVWNPRPLCVAHGSVTSAHAGQSLLLPPAVIFPLAPSSPHRSSSLSTYTEKPPGIRVNGVCHRWIADSIHESSRPDHGSDPGFCLHWIERLPQPTGPLCSAFFFLFFLLNMPGQDNFYHFGRRLKAFCQLPAVGVGMLKRVCGCKCCATAEESVNLLKNKTGRRARQRWSAGMFFVFLGRQWPTRDADIHVLHLIKHNSLVIIIIIIIISNDKQNCSMSVNFYWIHVGRKIFKNVILKKCALSLFSEASALLITH